MTEDQSKFQSEVAGEGARSEGLRAMLESINNTKASPMQY